MITVTIKIICKDLDEAGDILGDMSSELDALIHSERKYNDGTIAIFDVTEELEVKQTKKTK